jgi:hypothetical protein
MAASPEAQFSEEAARMQIQTRSSPGHDTISRAGTLIVESIRLDRDQTKPRGKR